MGTFSPWSSKATDIAQHCGLHWIKRIERGKAFYLNDGQDAPCNHELIAAIGPILHDKMLETVLTDPAALASLFSSMSTATIPRPLQTIALLEEGEKRFNCRQYAPWF